MAKRLSRSAIDMAGAFISAVSEALTDEGPAYLGLRISRLDKSLILNQDEAASYHRTVQALCGEFVKKEDLSRRSVERYLQDAMFNTLDLKNESEHLFDQRLAVALSELRGRLNCAPRSHKVFVPIHGLEPGDLPLTFSGVRFVRFGEAHRRQLIEVADASFKESIHELKEAPIWGSACAIIRISARDSTAAHELARRAARDVIDSINFFSDLIPYSHGWLRLSGEASWQVEVAPIISGDGTVSLPYTAFGPIATLSLANLRNDRRLLRHWRAANNLGRVARKKSAGELLSTSIRWAGRASVETRREQSFLLYAIALEAAILPQGNIELNYRLGLRISRLLGRDRQKRAELRRSVRDLYQVRSKIVHAGSYQVTDEELGGIRFLCKTILLRLLHKRRIWTMSKDEFDAWLESLTDN